MMMTLHEFHSGCLFGDFTQNISKPIKIISLLIILLGVILSSNSMAQVEDVNKNLEKSKNKSETTTTTTTDISETKNNGFIVFLGDVFMATIGAAQMAALQNKHIYPERVSLNIYNDFGSGFTNNTWNFSSSARVNWGIFGTELKYADLTDNTGKLNSFEWQVGILRIPIQSFNLEYGLGFISVINQSQSFGLSSFGFDLKLRPYRINIQSHYLWTQRTSLSTRFRKSFEFLFDIEFLERRKFHLGGMAKYSFQQYFEETNFSVVSIGVVMKVY